MRAQISFEYLVIVGIALLVIVPSLLFFLSFTGGGEDAVAHARIVEIGGEMVSTAADAYALGRHSWLTLDVNLPSAVESVRIVDEQEIVITYATRHGLSDAVFFSDVSVQNQGSDEVLVEDRVGIVPFRFESTGGGVNVSVSGDS